MACTLLCAILGDWNTDLIWGNSRSFRVSDVGGPGLTGGMNSTAELLDRVIADLDTVLSDDAL
ncbi:hypothetical protein, partial [Microbacterium sp. Root280D1]|uniref:hypothetical protein n=1 Tax=Microbacterium sp. Root280D1 TaxID=1736510 RepID=UPI000A407F75